MSFNALNTDGRPLTRQPKTSKTSSRVNREEASPVFLSTPFPSPISQLRRWSSRVAYAGAYTPLALRRYPSTPSTAKVGFAPLIPPLRPPALNAATKWHTGAVAAPVFLWTPFPHPRRGYADSRPVCARRCYATAPARLPCRPPGLTPRRRRVTPASPQACERLWIDPASPVHGGHPSANWNVLAQ